GDASYGRKAGVRLCLTEVRQPDGTPLLFLPLSITRLHASRELSFIDDGVSDYNGPIIFPAAAQLSQDAARHIVKAVVAALPRHDVIALCKMSEHVEGVANPLWPLTNLPCEASTHAISLTRPMEEIEGAIQGMKGIKKRDRAFQKLDGSRFFVTQTEA